MQADQFSCRKRASFTLAGSPGGALVPRRCFPSQPTLQRDTMSNVQRPRHVRVAAIAPGLIIIPMVLPMPFPYKLYLQLLGIGLFVTVYITLGVRSFRAIKRMQARQEAALEDFVKAGTGADGP